jgi:hypothetical protein
MSNKSRYDPVAYLVVLLCLGLFGLAVIFIAGLILIPVALVTVGGILLYRHYRLQRLRSTEHLPATIADRPQWTAPEAFQATVENRGLLDLAEEDTGEYSCTSLADAFEHIATSLYAQESFHEPPPHPDTTDRITLARYHDQLEAWQRKVSDNANFDTFLKAVVSTYLDLRAHFPKYALQSSPDPSYSKITTPLQIFNEEEAAQNLAAAFFNIQLKKRKLFQGMREQIEINIGDQESLGFYTTFARTPYTVLRRVRLPVVLPDDTRFAGMWAVAPQGRGKTTLLHTMVAGDIEKDAAIILMDSKGDLIEPFLRLGSIRDRLIVVGPDNPVGLNPLDIPHTDINKAVDNLEYLFSSLLEFKLTATQSMLLKAVLRALVTVFDKPTLETFRDVLANGPAKYRAQIDKLDPDLKDFFNKEFETENIKHRRQEVLQRLRLLLDHDVMRKMLLAPFTTFHIGKAMDQGKFIILDNSKGKLGEQAAEFLGRFFIAQVLAAAQERSFRPENTKKPVYFYIDEAHTVISRDEKITTVLHECRSQKIALILAHQETTQLSDTVLSAVQNCAIRFGNPDDEAPKLARSLRADVETLRKLKRGQFVGYIRDFSASGLVLDVEQTDFSSLPQLPLPKPARQIAAQAAVTEPIVPESDDGAVHAPNPAPSPTASRTADPGEPASDW